MTKHLWNVACKKDSIWVEWIHEAKVKGETIWMVKGDHSSNHGWKQLLGLRDKVRRYITCQVGNGTSIFFWHDKWWGPEPLSSKIPLEAVKHGDYPLNVKVKDMICNGEWNWPTTWANDFPILLTIPVPRLCDNSVDSFMWTSNDGKCGKYATNSTWQDLETL